MIINDPKYKVGDKVTLKYPGTCFRAVMVKCKACQGTGKMFIGSSLTTVKEHQCPTCSGSKTIRRQTRIEVYVVKITQVNIKIEIRENNPNVNVSYLYSSQHQGGSADETRIAGLTSEIGTRPNHNKKS